MATSQSTIIPRGVKDITGFESGRLTALRFVELREHRSFWEFQCACGRTTVVIGVNVTNGNTTSCGCYAGESRVIRLTRHGGSRTREYSCWRAMLNRCSKPNNTHYEYYGGRGIIVCERWHTFENFIVDMGFAPSPKHSLDRFPNNDGNYELGNVRWATRKEQMRNMRTNRFITYEGVTLCLIEWAERTGLKSTRIRQRLLAGWEIGRALTQPV